MAIADSLFTSNVLEILKQVQFMKVFMKQYESIIYHLEYDLIRVAKTFL